MTVETEPSRRGALVWLSVVVGLVLGFKAMGLASDISLDAWGYCMGMDPQLAVDTVYAGTLDGLTELPLLLVRLATCVLAFPFGFLVAAAVLRGRRLLAMLPAAALAGLLALSIAFVADLSAIASPPYGYYAPALCPHGRPPWWPGFLPLRDSGPSNGQVGP
jgi:hypothetical protein